MPWSSFEVVTFSPAAAGTEGSDMAKLIVPRGPLAVQNLRRPGPQSRILSCGTKVVGAGVASFGYTHRASQVVRLLNVQLFIEPVAYAAGLFLLVRVLTGFDQPNTAAAQLVCSWGAPQPRGQAILPRFETRRQSSQARCLILWPSIRSVCLCLQAGCSRHGAFASSRNPQARE